MSAGRLRTASAATLVAVVAVAPWLSTPMTERAVFVVSGGLYAVIAIWAAALAVERHRPRVPTVLLLLVGGVLLYGWAMTINGRPAPDLTRDFPHGHFVSWLPGAIDRRDAFAVMLPLTAVLLIGLALIDTARRMPFQHRLLVAITASATVMTALACVERWTSVSWPGGYDDGRGGTRFGSFGYHGNAAAFLELALPAALLLLTIELRATRSLLRRTLAITAPCVLLVGSAVNVSKFGQAMAVVIVFSFAVLATRARETASFPAGVVRALVALTLVAIAIGGFAARDRWREIPDGVSGDSGRALVWEASAHAWGRAPITGSGPGSFKLLLPHVAPTDTPELYEHWIVSPHFSGEPVTIWMYAHDDGLQTLVEWGLVAGTALAAIVLWPLVVAVRASIRSRWRSLPPGMAVVALGALFAHSLVDFPLQILPIQIVAAAWAAIAMSGPWPRATEPATLRTPRTATT